MRKRIVAGVASVALVAAGAVAGMSLAGSDRIGQPREVADLVVAEPVTGVAGRQTQARGKRGSPVVDFFYSRNALVPPVEGGGIVQPIRCPRGAGNPIAAGARTAEGIVVAYLSRAHPVKGSSPARTYFVGVEDVDSDNPASSGALVEVQCAKGIRVRD